MFVLTNKYEYISISRKRMTSVLTWNLHIERRKCSKIYESMTDSRHDLLATEMTDSFEKIGSCCCIHMQVSNCENRKTCKTSILLCCVKTDNYDHSSVYFDQYLLVTNYPFQYHHFLPSIYFKRLSRMTIFIEIKV